MYDNVFSILGKRGTGKTSVAFTLKRKIEENKDHPYDRVLPIIIPEMIPKDCSALGWILAIVKQEAKFIEEAIQNTNTNCEENKGLWDNCRYSEKEKKCLKLSQKVDKLIELCFAAKYNPANESSFYEVIGNSAKQAENYYQFACQISTLWSECIEAIIRLYKLENRKQQNDTICPMIYFIIDDVDLAPEKVDEILSIIIKYLSHPNVIVITTGDEELFLEVIENNLDVNIGRLPKEWRTYLSDNKENHNPFWNYEGRSNKSQELIVQTARLYLGKVMPTSTRYYLKLFNTVEQKRLFWLEEGINIGKSISELVEKFIGNDENTYNFIKQGDVIISFYFHFLGDTSRQISNAYLGIQELFVNLEAENLVGENKSSIVDKIYSYCVQFLYVCINANHELAEMIKHLDAFIDELFIYENNEWQLFLNYAYVNDYLEDLCQNELVNDKIRSARVILQIYSLLFFLENVLLMLEKKIEGGITGRKKNHGIKGMTQLLSGYVLDGKIIFQNGLSNKDFFVHYSTFLGKLYYGVNLHNRNSRFEVEFFHHFLDYRYNKSDININLFLSFIKESRTWFQELIGMLSNVYGNINLIGKVEMDNIRIFDQNDKFFSYQKLILMASQNLVYTALSTFNLKKTACDEMEEYTLNLANYNDETDNFNRFVSSQVSDIKSEKEYISLSQLLKFMEERCKTESIFTILNYCPFDFKNRIQKKLQFANQKIAALEDLLQEIASTIQIWDNIDHELYLYDVLDLMEQLEKLKSLSTLNLRRKIEVLQDYIINDRSNWDKEKSGYKMGVQWYRFIRDILKELEEINSNRIKVDKFEYEEEKTNELQEIIENIFNNCDVAITLKSKKECSDAVQLGLLIEIRKKLQTIYLYHTIVERYKAENNLSSLTLEKTFYIGNEEYTPYYYEMFIYLDKILNDNNLEEESIYQLLRLREFIKLATSIARKKYILEELLVEEKYGPLSD